MGVLVVVIKRIKVMKMFFAALTIWVTRAPDVMSDERGGGRVVFVAGIANMMHTGIVFMFDESPDGRKGSSTAFAVVHVHEDEKSQQMRVGES